MRIMMTLRLMWAWLTSFVIAVPEGSMERDYQRKRFSFGRLGKLEVYVAIVLRGRRHLFTVGSYRARSAPWYKRIVFTRHASWSLLNSLRDFYTPDVWYNDGSGWEGPAGYYHRDEVEDAHGPFRTREQAFLAYRAYCEYL